MDRVISFLINDLKLNEKDVVIVGVSFGPDSMALLYILSEIRKRVPIKIVCSHVNHNVRRASKREKIDLENWCLKNDIVFESMVIEKYSDDNFHNEARNIRYHFFEELIDKYHANYLMTAHHGDDLIETILMRLVRGSTLRGYSGFSTVVDYSGYKLVRPLIHVTKKEIEDFDKKHKIPYAIDKSNYKEKYTRNRYRKYMLPFLKNEDKNVHEHFLKFSRLLVEYDDFITEQVNKVFKKVYYDNTIDINKYFELEELLQTRVIYKILEDVFQDDLMLVNDRHVKLVRDLITSKKKNTYIYLPRGKRLVKSYDYVEIVSSIDEVTSYEIELIDYAVLPNGKHLEVVNECSDNSNNVCRLSSSDVSLPLYVRTRKHGDTMSLMGMNGHKKVKDIFIDKKISLSDRELWPVVVDSKGVVVWLPGVKKSKFNRKKSEKSDIIIRYY